jgi:Ca2+-binding RTX toxin-like protein
VTQAGDNDGDDALTSGAGDDILLGGGGSDKLNAGDGVNALLGDEGTVSLQDGVIEQVVTQAGDNDGDDALTSGAGDDILLGGGGSDTLDAGDGENALLGDDGVVTLRDGVVTRAQTQPGLADGDDSLTSGAGDDMLLGGGGDDTLLGGAGDDVLIGDAGKVLQRNGDLYLAEAGKQAGVHDGKDILVGNAGNDFMFGGGESDVFYGDLSEDVLIDEYGKLTMKNGKIDTIVARPSLAAQTMFDLYTVNNALPLSVADDSGPSLNVETDTDILDIEPWKSVSLYTRRVSHHNDLATASEKKEEGAPVEVQSSEEKVDAGAFMLGRKKSVDSAGFFGADTDTVNAAAENREIPSMADRGGVVWNFFASDDEVRQGDVAPPQHPEASRQAFDTPAGLQTAAAVLAGAGVLKWRSGKRQFSSEELECFATPKARSWKWNGEKLSGANAETDGTLKGRLVSVREFTVEKKCRMK